MTIPRGQNPEQEDNLNTVKHNLPNGQSPLDPLLVLNLPHLFIAEPILRPAIPEEPLAGTSSPIPVPTAIGPSPISCLAVLPVSHSVVVVQRRVRVLSALSPLLFTLVFVIVYGQLDDVGH